MMRSALCGLVAAAILWLALMAGDSEHTRAYAATWTPEPANPNEAAVSGSYEPWPTPQHRTNYRLNERFGGNFLNIRSGTWWLVVSVFAGLCFTISFRNVLIGVGAVCAVGVAGTFFAPPEFLSDTAGRVGIPVMPLIITFVGALALTGIFLYMRRK